jgi:iron complex outermembrane receptor protein
MTKRKLCLAVLAAVIGSGETMAHEDFETMVVSATRGEINLKDSPAAISVIDEAKIQKMTIFTADEAIGRTVGVMNRRTKGFMETTPAITIRGMSQAKDNLILVDGVPQNDANNGQVNWTMIDTETIERIEVLRGPYSSLHGGNAMGGVVSIFTRMPERTGATLKVGVGGSMDSVAPEDFRDLAFSGSIKATPSLALGLNYRQRSTAGYPTTHVNTASVAEGVSGATPYTTNIGGTSNLVGDTGDNWFEDDTAGISLKYAPSDRTRLNLSFARSESEYGYDQPHTYLRENGTPTLSTVPITTWLNGAVFARGGMAEQNNLGLGLTTAWGDLGVKLTLGRIDKQTETYIVGGTTPQLNAPTLVGGDGRIAPATDSNRTHADVQFDLPLFDRHVLTFGAAGSWAELSNERWNLNNWTDPSSKVLKVSDAHGKDQTYALFLQDAWFINDALTAYIGGRQTWWKMKGGEANFYNATGLTRSDRYGETDSSNFSPKASLVYRPTHSTTYRTSIGRAFRAPMLFELIQTSGIAGQTFVGNPDLGPETLTSWELGIDHSFANGINAIATYYQSKAKDLIETVNIPNTNPTEISPRNIGEAEIKGVELELHGHLPLGFSWTANYTWTDAEVTKNGLNPELVGKQLTHTPEHMYNLGLDWRNDAWTVSVNHSRQSKRYTRADNLDTVTKVPGSTDAFSLTDIKATYAFSENHSASLGINNVFDEEYRQFYLSPGRFWFVELRSRY